MHASPLPSVRSWCRQDSGAHHTTDLWPEIDHLSPSRAALCWRASWRSARIPAAVLTRWPCGGYVMTKLGGLMLGLCAVLLMGCSTSARIITNPPDLNVILDGKDFGKSP